MKLSIVICVYNTALCYLEECLQSIKNSTLKEYEGEYEIVMIDDGSHLDYSELVEKYNLSYVKTENRGIYSARKTGAHTARGEYIAYCDSDDTVSFNYHKPMLDAAISVGADMVINDWAFHTERTRFACSKDDFAAKDLELSGDDILRAFFSKKGTQHSYFVLWNKIYKTSLIVSSFEKLEKAGMASNSSYSEDAAINFFAWREAKRLKNIHTGYYFYRQHSQQTVNVVSEERLRTQIAFMSETFSIMENNIGNTEHADEILENLNAWRALMSRVHYSHASENKYENLYEFIKESYGVEKLKKACAKDSVAYVGDVLLGRNFSEIDEALFAIWTSSEALAVSYCKRDTYTERCVEYLRSCGKISDEKTVTIKIPKMKNKLIDKLLHNPVIYKISLVLFKKGSKTRAFLKKIF